MPLTGRQDIIDPIKEALTCLDNNNIAAFRSFIQLRRAHPVRQFVLFLAATYGAIEFLQAREALLPLRASC